MSRCIAVFTGTRAEYGLLAPILRSIAQSDELDLRLIVAGTHLSVEHSRSIQQILDDGFLVDFISETVLSADSAMSTVKSMALGLLDVSRFLDQVQPDALVVLGDRYEVLAAASAALPHGVPVVHLHGGEVTTGAFDDSIRHAVTKLSSLHLVASEEFRQRVIQLGEDPERVFTCTAPGVSVARDGLMEDRSALEHRLGFSLAGRSCLVAYHPATRGNEDPEITVEGLLSAVESYGFDQVLMVHPNADPAGLQIASVLRKASEDRGFRLLENLGHRAFLSLLSVVDVLVGNSSSGIIEAPVVGTPSVNVGGRQSGRPQAATTVNSDANEASVRVAIGVALDMYPIVMPVTTPYGQGSAMAETAVRLLETMSKRELLQKRFWDFG